MTNDMKRGRPRKYATPEESKAAQLEQIRKYYQTHKEEKRDIEKERSKNFRSGVYGRAYLLSKNYEKMDKNANRGESTITPEWIIGNIFASKCYWCGETDWRQLGCDRIDNTKAHTPDNVVCSCSRCNIERNRHSMDYFEKYQVSKETQGVQLALF